MQISPNHRRRAVRAHYLSQQGRSQKKIAETLSVSRATVRADLQLVETHWSEIAAAAADDLLLESLKLLHLRLSLAMKNDTLKSLAKHLAPAEILRAQDAQESQLTALAREIRHTVQAVHQRAEQRPNQPALDSEDQKVDETNTKLTISATPNSTISSPQQEIVDSEPSEEQFPEQPPQEDLIKEAITHFPHLEGQSEAEILQFLDQLTNPNTEEQPKPTPIYADAAG